MEKTSRPSFSWLMENQDRTKRILPQPQLQPQQQQPSPETSPQQPQQHQPQPQTQSQPQFPSFSHYQTPTRVSSFPSFAHDNSPVRLPPINSSPNAGQNPNLLSGSAGAHHPLFSSNSSPLLNPAEPTKISLQRTAPSSNSLTAQQQQQHPFSQPALQQRQLPLRRQVPLQSTATQSSLQSPFQQQLSSPQHQLQPHPQQPHPLQLRQQQRLGALLAPPPPSHSQSPRQQQQHPSLPSPTFNSPSSLTSPMLTSPMLTSPTFTSPTFTSPSFTSPMLTSPMMTSPTTFTSPSPTNNALFDTPSPGGSGGMGGCTSPNPQEDRAKWGDTERVEFLIRSYLGSIKEGQITSYGLKKSQWGKIQSAFNERFGVHHSVEQLKNGFANIKRQFKDTKFLKEQEGWAWDEENYIVSNTPEEWIAISEKHPRRYFSRLVDVRTQTTWRSKPLELYKGMYSHLESICYGNLVARDDIEYFSDFSKRSLSTSNLGTPGVDRLTTRAITPDPEVYLGYNPQSGGGPDYNLPKRKRVFSSGKLDIIDSTPTKKPTGASLHQIMNSLRPLKVRLGEHYYQALLLLKENANAQMFLSLQSDEDKLAFIHALMLAQ